MAPSKLKPLSNAPTPLAAIGDASGFVWEAAKSGISSALTGLSLPSFQRSIPKIQIPERLSVAIQTFLGYAGEFRNMVSDHLIPFQERRTQFEDAVIELMKNPEAAHFGTGVEGMVYRFEFGDTAFIVIKRWGDQKSRPNVTRNEFELLLSAGRATEDRQRFPNMRVPQGYHRVVDTESEYIVMEYITGKTISTLQLESLINEEYIPMISALRFSGKISADESEKIAVFLHSQSSKIWQLESLPSSLSLNGFYAKREEYQVFLTDTDAERIFLEYAKIFQKLGLLQIDFSSRLMNVSTGKTETRFIESEIARAALQYPIFGEDQAILLSNEAQDFVETLHENRVYHNDLHGNNFMVNTSGELVVIDFGSGTPVDPQDSETMSPYGYWGIPDEDFHSTVRKLGGDSWLQKSAELRKQYFKALEKDLPILEKFWISPKEYLRVLRSSHFFELANFLGTIQTGKQGESTLNGSQSMQITERVAGSATGILHPENIFLSAISKVWNAGKADGRITWDSWQTFCGDAGFESEEAVFFSSILKRLNLVASV